jgi:Putative auto-transporter adhesin, head GIN domain
MRPLLVASPFLLLAVAGVANNAWGSWGGHKHSSSGPATTRSFAIGPFEAVSAEGSYDVRVVNGPAIAVSATGSARELDRLDIRVEGNSLRIGTKPGKWHVGWGSDDDEPVVTVTAPLVRAVAVSGSGNMTVDRIDTDAFKASVSGSGDLQLAALRAKTVDFAVNGSGNLDARGTADDARINVGGSGDVDADGLSSNRATISVGGSGNLSTTVTGSATIAVGGSGDVSVRGTNSCTISKSGSGEASCSR